MTTKKPEPFKTPPVERKFEGKLPKFEAVGSDFDPELYALVRRILAKDKRKRDDENDPNSDTMERAPEESEGAAAELQALTEKIRASIDELVSSAIPEDSKVAILYNIIREISEACKGNILIEGTPQKLTPPTPDLSAIPRWRGRKRDGMPLDFLKLHYGQWLAAFEAQEESVFQDQIRAHDPGLITGIHNQLREEGQGRKVRDFVKTRSARVDRELESMTIEESKKHLRLAHNFLTRTRKAAEASKR